MSDRIELLARLASAFAAQPDGPTPARRVCAAAAEILGADGGSIAMVVPPEDALHALTATDATAQHLADAHELLGVGPAASALTRGRMVLIDLRDPEPAWSAYAEAAARETDAVVLAAVPMHAGGQVIGVMSLYRSTPGRLADPAEHATFLADTVGAALLRDQDGVESGTAAWSNQAAVHQATGMVVAQLAVPAADALVILRAHAFATGTDLATVAGLVLAGDLDLRRDTT